MESGFWFIKILMEAKNYILILSWFQLGWKGGEVSSYVVFQLQVGLKP